LASAIYINKSFASGASGLLSFGAPVTQDIGDEGHGWYQVNVVCPYKRHQF
jgi:hypothetical protein